MSGYTFISYSHEDTEFAEKLARQLQRHGVSIWLDQWHDPPDDNWNRAIELAIRACRNCLIILSPAAVNSWVVRQQFFLAAETDKAIVSVVHQPCDIPLILQDVPRIDFTGQDQRAAVLQLVSEHLIETGTRPKQQTRFAVPRPDLAEIWSGLRPLLWPGWLGPAMVAILLVAGGVFYRIRTMAELRSPQPTVENLVIVQPTPTPPALPTPIGTKVRAKDGKLMVLVPAGEFLMGSAESDPTANEDEMPQRRVFLDEFWIDKTEISNAQYRRCVEAGACTPAQKQTRVFLDDQLPVVGVNWEQAVAYCQWVGARLPSEAEWEKSARGTDGRLYPWGNEFDDDRLNYCDSNCIADWRDLRGNDGHRYTAPTGSYPAGASPYGALDMSGNVWEWTADWYAPNSYANAASENPTGPSSGLQRVIRGGSWYYYGASLRVARRHRDTPSSRYNNIGFRCALSGQESVDQNLGHIRPGLAELRVK